MLSNICFELESGQRKPAMCFRFDQEGRLPSCLIKQRVYWVFQMYEV